MGWGFGVEVQGSQYFVGPGGSTLIHVKPHHNCVRHDLNRLDERTNIDLFDRLSVGASSFELDPRPLQKPFHTKCEFIGGHVVIRRAIDHDARLRRRSPLER